MNLGYIKALRHPEWFRKRNLVLKRDNFKCRICGSAENLVVHHRQYHKGPLPGGFYPPWKYRLKYLVTLCSNCHRSGHSYIKIKTQ